MSNEHYTIDDLVASIRRKDVVLGAKMDVGCVLFYIHMAYALGMGFQPSPLYAKIAELDRIHARQWRRASG
jgi:hypothetical protein